MKGWKVLAAMVFTGMLLSLVACGDSNNTNVVNLADMHGGSTKVWKTISVIWEFNPDGSMPITGTDDLIVVNSDGTAMKVWGELAKPGEKAKVDQYNWEATGDVIKCTGVDTGDMVLKIITLTDQLFVYESQLEIPGAGTFTVKYVSVPAVNANPYASTENKRLTSGMSKLWKISGRTKDGNPYPLEAWQLDDIWLMNTDGTAYFLRGENHESPTKILNNDAFFWQLTENKTKLDVEFSENPNDVYDSTIIELTDTRFVIEATVSGSVIRTTYIPVVKK